MKLAIYFKIINTGIDLLKSVLIKSEIMRIAGIKIKKKKLVKFVFILAAFSLILTAFLPFLV
ncbi:MAG: hypothetical protein ABH867_02120 [Patescibacteria group bacterium]|nr:hypothetical protein [Patescibacteria group bacterium]